jgi:peptidyl-prolyl cis-trans isomerase SurA
MGTRRRILAVVLKNVRGMLAIASMIAPAPIRHRFAVPCRLIVAGLFALILAAAPRPAAAQVVALVNGVPITELDIAQRIKIIQVTSHKSASRQDALKALVDDQVKIFVAKRYQVAATDQDVDNAFATMGQRSHLQAHQMEEQMARQGLSVAAFKSKLRADISWGNLIRGKFASTLQISDSDIRSALQKEGDKDKEATESKVYTLYPITFVAPNGASEGARRNEAENLRSRFTSCDDGLKLARVLRGVVVREPVKRNSGDLAPQLREMLDKMEIGRLTLPEITPQGIQMFALCERNDSGSDSAAKRAAREAIFNKRFEAESKKYLDEVRRQSMIEYR